ncbi:MAG TPA: transglycosylase SLT domain-containing protein [Pyrinomonadaceae bacterium]|nr:transglycosylase SLT domain-containing protein [Pyrinomonadaceae bacterium]
MTLTYSKSYQEMSEEERLDFINQRAQHINIMIGGRSRSIPPDGLRAIKFWVDAYARRVGNNRAGLWNGDTRFILERARAYAPTIIRAFKDHNVPPIVGLYIPFIETEYTNTPAENYAGAAGLFLFIPQAARAFGVEPSERTNIDKMAPAAAKYFRNNIMMFGDDPMSVALAIAGYSRAPESVMRDLRNVILAPNNNNKERDFWLLVSNEAELDNYFQNENKNYVPRFYAAAIVGETPRVFGIDAEPLSALDPTPGTQTTAPRFARQNETERDDVAVRNVARLISGDDGSFYISEAGTRDIAAKVEFYRGSLDLKDRLNAMRRACAEVRDGAQRINLKTPLVIYAALAETEGGSDPAATARQMSQKLLTLRATFGTDTANSALLLVAAYPYPFNPPIGTQQRTVHPLYAELIRSGGQRSRAAPSVARSVWFLREQGNLRPDAYELVVRTLAIGVIAQNPRLYGIDADPLAC